jgi:hypothetical protein
MALEITTWTSLAISLITIVPILAAASIHFSRRKRGRGLVGFGRRSPVDVVLTLSAETPSRPGKRIIRPLTGIGQVIGATEVAKCISKFYLGKAIRVHLSGHITNRLDGDEVILGGPVRNEEAKRLLQHIGEICNVADFSYSDETPCAIHIKTITGRNYAVDDYKTDITNGFPKRDLCLIVAANERTDSSKSRRMILCSGFTSYGTSAGTQYFFNDMALMKPAQLHRVLGPGRGYHNWMILVVEVEFSGPNITRLSPRFACGA